MMPQLYEYFQGWADKGSIYVYGDPHFGDEDIKAAYMEWPAAAEQVKIINSIVTKNDTLIILGDVGDYEYIKDLRAGRKILIAGNHDTGLSYYKRKVETLYFNVDFWEGKKDSLSNLLSKLYPKDKIEIVESYAMDNSDAEYRVEIDNKLFDEVYSGPLFIGEKILLSHEPIFLPFAYNIHGHVHGGLGKNYYQTNYNACSNCVDFMPQHLGKILKEACLSRINSIHRDAIESRKKVKQ